MSILQKWIEFKAPFLKPRSVEAYEYQISILQRYLSRKRLKLTALKTQDVQAFVSWMYANKYSQKTVREAITVLKMVFDYVEAMDSRGRFSSERIMKRVKLPKAPQKLPVCMTKDECECVLAYLKSKNKRIYTIALFAYLTGMRIGEMLSLKIKDVDTKNNTIYIAEQKNGKQSYLPLIPHADVLEYIKYRNTLNVDHEYLFVGVRMERLGIDAVQKYLRRTSKETGIKFSAHTFRHSAATHLVQAGVPLPAVQKLLRHSNIATTMIYVNFMADDVRDQIVTKHPFAECNLKKVEGERI